MASALGKLSECAGAIQESFKTLGDDPNVHRLPFYSEGLQDPGRMGRDDELGNAVHNPYDETDPAPTLVNVSGPVVVAADMNTLPFWLSLLFGSPSAPTGSGPYSRVFTSAVEPDFGTVQFKTAASRWKVISGLAFSGLDFDLTKQDGYRQFTFAGAARDVTIVDDDENLPLDLTGVTSPARAKAPATVGELLINDTAVGRLTGGRFSYQSGLNRQDYVDGDARASEMERDGGTTVTLTPTIRLGRAASQNGILDLLQGAQNPVTGAPKTPFNCKLRLSIGAGLQVTFEMPRCFGERKVETIGGPGGLEITPEIRATQSATAPAVTATLVNAVAAFS